MNEFTACTAWLSARPGSPEIFGKGLLPVCGKSPGGDDSAARRQIALPARVFAQQLSASAIPPWLIRARLDQHFHPIARGPSYCAAARIGICAQEETPHPAGLPLGATRWGLSWAFSGH